MVPVQNSHRGGREQVLQMVNPHFSKSVKRCQNIHFLAVFFGSLGYLWRGSRDTTHENMAQNQKYKDPHIWNEHDCLGPGHWSNSGHVVQNTTRRVALEGSSCTCRVGGL